MDPQAGGMIEATAQTVGEQDRGGAIVREAGSSRQLRKSSQRS